ncbi:MAG: TetR/AcrR family transcriptional regulator [Candidatus Thorarchaeota archaeon]
MKISKLSRREREKKQHQLQRRNEILKAAKDRFFKNSYDEVSMDDIAADLELSKTTLYIYFANKASLFFAIVTQGVVLLRDTFKNAVLQDTTGLEKIMKIIQAFFEYIQNYSDYYRLNLSARAPRFMKMLQKGNHEIENADEYVKLKEELLEIIVKAINLGIKDGTLRKDMDHIKTVMFLSSAIENMVYLSPVNQLLLDTYNISAEDYLQHSTNLLLRGLAGENL